MKVNLSQAGSSSSEKCLQDMFHMGGDFPKYHREAPNWHLGTIAR